MKMKQKQDQQAKSNTQQHTFTPHLKQPSAAQPQYFIVFRR